ncbi:hypothetical protein HYR99_16585 [Candidatus Poribacteria bacterium]|nr:hypothetical protein [Candidatus Poribacteria bacterium]
MRASVDWAQKLYDDDYIAPGPPPSPKLTAYPGDRRVMLVWNGGEAEKYADPTDKEKIFEGYRVYRREITYDKASGKPVEDWKLLAELDKKSATGNFFTVAHVGKKSDATITNEGLEPGFSDFFKNAEYLIKFTSNTAFEVLNASTFEILEYNATLEDGAGYAVIKDPSTGEPFPDGAYRPGELIYFGGLYVKIDGNPVAGDIFKIVSTTSQPLGQDKGVKNFYTDENLINGTRYIYAVTSYDTGNLKTGLPAMESSKIDTATHVFPRSQPAGYNDPSTKMEVSAKGTVKVEPLIVEPPKVTGHRYKVVWQGAKAASDATGASAVIGGAKYTHPQYEIIDLDAGGKKVVEAQEFGWYNPDEGHAVEVLSPLFDGIVLKLTGVDVSYSAPTANKIAKVDLVSGEVTDWSVDIQSSGSGGGTTTGPNIFWATYYRPHTYRIKLVGGNKVEVTDVTDNQPVPFHPGRADGYAINNRGWKDVYDPAATHNADENVDLFRIYLKGTYIVIKDPKRQLNAGDEFVVEMAGVQSPQDGDEILIATQAPTITLTKANVEEQLKRVRVVPNPYFLTNRAVTAQGTDKCFFTHLPAKCRIRIYTIVGEFVKELTHDSGQPFDPENRSAQGDAGGTEPFELLSYNDQALASGVYIYSVEALDDGGATIGKKIGRFAVIR